MKILLLKVLLITSLINFLPTSFAKSLIPISKQQASDDKAMIEKTLTNFHQAAANANLTQYFNLLTDDAIYLGTDASERWSKETFNHYVEPMFKQGRGWTYTKVARHININKDGNSAFFDELLNNKNYGLCRSTGMLRKTPQGWKIAQYSLSIPLPNALAKNIVKQIQNHQQVMNHQQKSIKLSKKISPLSQINH